MYPTTALITITFKSYLSPLPFFNLVFKKVIHICIHFLAHNMTVLYILDLQNMKNIIKILDLLFTTCTVTLHVV